MIINKESQKMETKSLSGADVLIECLKEQNVEYIWGIPGGVTIPIYDALVDSGIKLILVRHEQGAMHAAEGYARATGRPGVVCVTSGPGATNTVTGLLNAYMDSAPVIVITGQTVTSMLGKDAFQEGDIFGMTLPVVKHSYLVKDANDLPRVMKEAFYIAQTGRPGPVHIDIPKDVATSPCTVPLNAEMDLPGYKPRDLEDFDREEVERIAGALRRSKRPVLYVGHGAVISNACSELMKLATTLHAPVVNTLLGKGAFPEDHELSLGMFGMHGTVYANKAVSECDLIFSIGGRWDDRITGKLSEFCVDAVKIHIDIDPAEINKIIRPDYYVIGDAKHVLRELNKHISRLDTDDWWRKIEKWRNKFPLKCSKKGGLKVPYIVDTLYKLTKGEAIIVTDVGQHQMWTAQFYKVNKNRSWISSGGAGTMGFGFPAALGAQSGRPNELVVAIVGDGGFQMTMSELATMMNNNLPVKIIVMENRYLGMVRQWQELFFDNRLSGVDLTGNPNFALIAKAYGCKSFRIRRNADVERTLKEAIEYKGPCLIWAELIKEDNVFPMVPAGAPLSKMIISPPKSAPTEIAAKPAKRRRKPRSEEK